LYETADDFTLFNFENEQEELDYVEDRINEFKEFINRLETKPKVVTIALSPKFTPRKTMEYITNGVMNTLTRIYKFF